MCYCGERPLNVLSLCSGVGGLDLGLERAGMTVTGQVEIDPWCRSILARHWPHVPKHDDVYTAAAWWRSEERPHIDLVCGGVPCQPHSVAGLGLGTADPRWLWPGFTTVIEATSPAFVVVENSPRLRTSGLRDILISLADLGFDAWWSRIPAAAMGAPHLRWRLILIAAHPDRVQLRHQPGGRDGAYGPYQAVTGFDGAVWALADPNGDPRHPRWPSHTSESTRRRHAHRSRIGADDVADTDRQGLAVLRRQPGDDGKERAPAERDGHQRGSWPPEPGVGRVADWAPDRVDRLRGIGNAVVPQVAEYVGQLIMAAAA